MVPALGNRLRDLPESSQEFTENLEDDWHHGTHPHALLANQIPNLQEKWYRRNTAFLLTSRKTELRSVQENQDHKNFLQEAHWWCSTSGRKLWRLDDSRSRSSQWRMLISKQTPIRSRGTRYSHSMDTIIPVQNTNFSGDEKEFTKVLGFDDEIKSHLHRQFFGEFGKSCERFSGNHCTSTLYLIWYKWYCWKSSTQIKRRNFCGAVANFEMSKTSWQLGKHIMKTDLLHHSKAQLSVWNIILFPPKTSQGYINLVRQFLRETLLGYALYAGGIWNEDIFVADIEKLGRVRNPCSKTQCKRNIDAPKKWWTFHTSNRSCCPRGHGIRK